MQSGFTVSEAERARAERVDQLVASGKEGIPGLIELLTDPSWVVRRGVVAGLGSLGDAALEPLCRVLMERRDDEARVAAAVDALVVSTGNAEGPVTALLSRHADPAVVADAAQILGRRRNPDSIPRLVELISHPDDNVAVSATEALGRIGGRAAVDPLVQAVDSGNFFRVFPAIDVLGRSGDPRAVPALAGLLDNPMYMLEAARALGRTADRGAVAPLASLLQRPLEATTRVAALSLAELHARHGERYGETRSVEDAIRAALSAPVSVRRLSQALINADEEEQKAISLLLGILGGVEAVPSLTRLLEGSESVAASAAGALRRMGQETDARTLDVLRNGDSQKRKALLPVISRSGAADAVTACLGDPDPTVRSMACDALGRIGNPSCVPALFPLLSDPHPAVVQSAVAAIQSLGSHETERLGLEAARSENPTVRRAALRILSYFGYGSALDTFVAALEAPDARVRDAALQGLPFLDDRRTFEVLFEAAQKDDPRLRAGAMRALGFASGDLRVSAFLLRGLDDPDPWVRYYACQALARVGEHGAVHRIGQLLADEAGQVRVAAVEALSQLQGKEALAALEQAATSDEEDVRRAALIGLGIARSETSIPVLMTAASSSDPNTRLVAVSALADFPSDKVLSALARAATDADENVRTAAVGFLAGRRGPEATRILVDLLTNAESREQALSALANFSEGRIDGILHALDSASDELAPELTSALARMRRRDATAALFNALELRNPAARKAAATTLAALGTPVAYSALQRHAAHDADPEVRRICALLLAD